MKGGTRTTIYVPSQILGFFFPASPFVTFVLMNNCIDSEIPFHTLEDVPIISYFGLGLMHSHDFQKHSALSPSRHL